MPKIRTYSELIQNHAFEDRFEYLALRGDVGAKTFGFDRWINQEFYRSREWKYVRDQVIARDNGQDLACDGHDIYDRIIIHHMNPMTADDIIDYNEDILNPEYLISTSHTTHNAIHYGDKKLLRQPLVERRPGDTALWQRR